MSYNPIPGMEDGPTEAEKLEMLLGNTVNERDAMQFQLTQALDALRQAKAAIGDLEEFWPGGEVSDHGFCLWCQWKPEDGHSGECKRQIALSAINEVLKP